MAKTKEKSVDKAVSSVISGYAPDAERERQWKADDAMRDIMRVEGHKKDKGLMSDVKKRVKEVSKAVGC
jgi:hypothetical protein